MGKYLITNKFLAYIYPPRINLHFISKKIIAYANNKNKKSYICSRFGVLTENPH